MELGEQIFRLRGEKNLSQEALADALGVSRQSVSKWENGVSVPELDKLVQMSELFGVSLDELVKGEAARPPEDLAEKQAVPEGGDRAGGGTRRITGIILLCFGAAIALFLFFLGGGLFSLLCALPFLACGVLCLTVRRRVGLWCAWTVWLCVELYLRWATGLRWSVMLMTLSWTPQMNYVRLIIAWVMALVPVLLMVCTVRSFRSIRCPFGGRPAPYACGWAALAGVWALRGGLYRYFFTQYRAIHDRIDEGLEAALFWTRTLGDWAAAALLCVMLAWTLALLREHKKKERPDAA